MVVAVGAVVVFAGHAAGFDLAYPSRAKPWLVLMHSQSAQNGNPIQYRLLDVSASPALVVAGAEAGDMTFTSAKQGVVIHWPTGQDQLGDILLGDFRYVWRSGHVVLLRQTPVYSSTALSQKRYPDDVLTDRMMRAALLKLIGKAEFRKFRLGFTVQAPLQKIGSRFVTGQGCMPHDCGKAQQDDGGSQALFVLDLKLNRAWAVDYRHEHGRSWGVLTADDVIPARIIAAWMQQNGLASNQIAAQR